MSITQNIEIIPQSLQTKVLNLPDKDKTIIKEYLIDFISEYLEDRQDWIDAEIEFNSFKINNKTWTSLEEIIKKIK